MGFNKAKKNIGATGTFVNVGSHGIYYRKKISDDEGITDADAQDFINDLNKKEKRISLFKLSGILLSIAYIAVLIFAYQYTNIETTGYRYDDYIRTSTASNVNIRQNPDQDSKILGSLISGKRYMLIDESIDDWYKINFNGQEGFVSKKFSEKKTVKTKIKNPKVSDNNIFEQIVMNDFFMISISVLILFVTLLYRINKYDKKRHLVEIYYEFDGDYKNVHENFIHSFSEILKSEKVWQYLKVVNTDDYKYTSGAKKSITRAPLSILTDGNPTKIFRTNVTIPYMNINCTGLFFFPERLIIKRGSKFETIMYNKIDYCSNTIRFIETETAPQDSKIVGYTWRYLNKDGSPDKRFSDNYQIPLCEYSEYEFVSASGLNEVIATSKAGCFDNFIDILKNIGYWQNSLKYD